MFLTQNCTTPLDPGWPANDQLEPATIFQTPAISIRRNEFTAVFRNVSSLSIPNLKRPLKPSLQCLPTNHNIESWKTHRCIERLLIVFLHGELKGNLRCAEKMGSTLFLWDYPFWFQSCVHRHVQNETSRTAKLKQMRTRNRKINMHTELELVSTVGQTLSGVCYGFCVSFQALICFVWSCAWLLSEVNSLAPGVSDHQKPQVRLHGLPSWWNIPMVAF